MKLLPRFLPHGLKSTLDHLATVSYGSGPAFRSGWARIRWWKLCFNLGFILGWFPPGVRLRPGVRFFLHAQFDNNICNELKKIISVPSCQILNTLLRTRLHTSYWCLQLHYWISGPRWSLKKKLTCFQLHWQLYKSQCCECRNWNESHVFFSTQYRMKRVR